MGSFFEKLKRGMGIEAPTEERVEEREEVEKIEEIEEKPVKKKGVGRPKKIEVEEKAPEIKIEKLEPEEVPEKEEKPTLVEAPAGKEKWPEPEGQLTIDVYQTEKELVIQTAIAGVKPEGLDITLERDIITIKGSRQKPFEEDGDYFTQECYWGPFSREVILPVEVDPNRAEATMKDGILTIRIPKLLKEKLRRIKVRV